eukprot:TRINITY_DN14280_c0_g1_i10.p1 TRINITY_DN14280_c0_g1~~TRINITY_DN14280_c0_g1_i10.p1  ORF type:complete len:430 (+),score=121.74 TRINITY_DN14280_c0_g1_i10:197-1486(+)
MSSSTASQVLIGATAAACACAATAYGLYTFYKEPQEQQEAIEEDKEPELRVSLTRSDSLRNEERRTDLMNRVEEVQTFLKDDVHSEIPNPMVVEDEKSYLSERFLTSESCIPLGAFTIGGKEYHSIRELMDAPRYKKAGPKTHLYYDPSKVKPVIVTCGGVCPGLNVVIRELVMMLCHGYKVQEVYGVKYGFEGFWKQTSDGDCYVRLVPEMRREFDRKDKKIVNVQDLHTRGGTILGTSRGGFDGEKIADAVQAKGINQIYAIGGDGTHRGLLKLSKIFRQRNIEVSLIGIPKTIDNDLAIIDKTFGFDTAVEIGSWAIRCADVEANSAEYGVGLVKVMGRHAGHIAMHAALASRDVNICIIPESPFDVYGPKGLLEYIVKRLKQRHHCVIVIAEGAGGAAHDVNLESTKTIDASGNVLPPVRARAKK